MREIWREVFGSSRFPFASMIWIRFLGYNLSSRLANTPNRCWHLSFDKQCKVMN